MRRLAPLVAILAFTVIPSWVPAQAFAPNAEALVLRPGDAVRISVWRNAELSGEFVIASDGTLTHPLYRTLRVAGISLPEAESRLQAFLQRFESSPQFVLEPLLRVSVSGEVNRPNLYTLRPETSVSQAVALAGGPTDRARRDRIRLIRDHNVVDIDLSDVGSGATRLLIRSGDEILVERRRAVFREYIAPVITVAGATAAIVNAVLRAR